MPTRLAIIKGLFNVASWILVADVNIDSFGRSEAVGSERRTIKHSDGVVFYTKKFKSMESLSWMGELIDSERAYWERE